MTWSLIGWTQSQDSSTLAAVAALADPHIRVSSNDILLPPELARIWALYALGANTTRAQLRYASLRKQIGVPNWEIKPIDVAAEPTSPVFSYIQDLRGQPLSVSSYEAVNAYAAEGATSAARSTILAWVGYIRPVIPAGKIFTLRTTNTSTLTANAWTNGTLTLDQTLLKGTYALIGARYSSTGGQAFRFVPVGGAYRPGGLGVDTDTDQEPNFQRRGGLGVWFTFDSDNVPTVDFLSNSADTSQVVDLDLVHIG